MRAFDRQAQDAAGLAGAADTDFGDRQALARVAQRAFYGNQRVGLYFAAHLDHEFMFHLRHVFHQFALYPPILGKHH